MRYALHINFVYINNTEHYIIFIKFGRTSGHDGDPIIGGQFSR